MSTKTHDLLLIRSQKFPFIYVTCATGNVTVPNALIVHDKEEFETVKPNDMTV